MSSSAARPSKRELDKLVLAFLFVAGLSLFVPMYIGMKLTRAGRRASNRPDIASVTRRLLRFLLELGVLTAAPSN